MLEVCAANFYKMFRPGQGRKLIHNIKLASLLSFVAGLVNISGLMCLHLLTTNITGHFAFFAEGIVNKELGTAISYGILVLSFFFGAFFSSFLMEVRLQKGSRMIGTAPVVFESLILVVLAFLPEEFYFVHASLVAGILLFSMGMQNALVTTISSSIVRTTHLTGLFTDLGIELSQLVFYRKKRQQQSLLSSLKLHLSIILGFLLGILIGGWLYASWGSKCFLLAAILLLAGMISRKFRLYLKKLNRLFRKQAD